MLIHPQLLSRPIAKSDESMRKKATYRIHNWNKYNKALIKRGSLTFWFDEEAIAAWYEEERTGRRGCPRTYSDVAIQCTLTLRGVYHLPLRGTQGLLESLLDLMGLGSCTRRITRRCVVGK